MAANEVRRRVHTIGDRFRTFGNPRSQGVTLCDNDGNERLHQIVDTGNSNTITSGSTSGHTPGTPWTGTVFKTDDNRIQETITIVTAFDASGDPIPDLGIEFTWFGDSITIPASIPPFHSRRLLHTTDWLSNQWAEYNVEIEPTRALVSGETIVVTTRHSTVSGNKFLFPLNYEALQDIQTASRSRAIISAAKVPTYFASFRSPTGTHHLALAPTVATPVRAAEVWHAASSTKTLKLRRCEIYVASVTGSADVTFSLQRTTTAPTGGLAITPAKAKTDASAIEATLLAGTVGTLIVGGTLGDVFSSYPLELANQDNNASQVLYYMDAVLPEETPQLRKGVAEGLTVILESDSATTLAAIVNMRLTEE